MTSKLDAAQGRGDFFKALGILAAGFMAERVEAAVIGSGPRLLRPPGALDELNFLVTCTRCDRCILACPKEALFRVPSGAGLAAGTPHIQPRIMPCFLCEDLPCVKACPEGALQWPRREMDGRMVEGAAAAKLGVALLNEDLCLAWGSTGEPCSACMERCPLPGQALRRDGEGPFRPVVGEDGCVGCGHCVFVCPVSEPALEIVPR
jgi:MauM/NapG family ferredoxin protein